MRMDVAGSNARYANPGRTIRDVIKDWRAAEAELPRLTGRIPSPEVTARVDSVRAEHAAALDREIDHARSVEERARRDRALLYPF
jgi:hypothetical protein